MTAPLPTTEQMPLHLEGGNRVQPRHVRPGRIPCINPRCRRTAPADKYEPGSQIICGQCFRSLPPSLRRRYRTHARRERRVLQVIDRRMAKRSITPELVNKLRDAFAARGEAIWRALVHFYRATERPEGLDSFLEEIGLAGGRHTPTDKEAMSHDHAGAP